ncbi:MAG TPA: hypothetical protein PLI18_02855 [Pirellulaceae bacterium]|nr:hypothetical protein [Pirellulaceae bacterium]
MGDGRLLIDAPASGARNMAVDEALLEGVGDGGRPCLRFYRWREPTLSLGYFQPLADRRLHDASGSIPVVRRVTGGGAIVHDRELTYSLVLPIRDRWAAAHRELYDRIHGAIVGWLRQLGLSSARLHPGLPQDDEPFLCFQRRSDGDVEGDGYKVLGSAQRRTRTAMLQHGSLLLGRSRFAPELPGVWDLIAQSGRSDKGGSTAVEGSEPVDTADGTPSDPGDEAARVRAAIAALGDLIGHAIEIEWAGSELTEQERSAADRWERERFLARSWTGRR